MLVPIWNYVVAVILLLILIAWSIIGIYLLGQYHPTGCIGCTGITGFTGCTGIGYTGTVIISMDQKSNILKEKIVAKKKQKGLKDGIKR